MLKKRPRATHIHDQNEPAQSQRMTNILNVMDKALMESRKGINVANAVAECYGEDVSIFAAPTSSSSHIKQRVGENNNKEERDSAQTMLANLIDETLERLNNRIKSKFSDFLKQEGLNSRLLLLESIIKEFEDNERSEHEREEEDKISAMSLAKKSALPEGIEVEHVLKYHNYRLKIQERDSLLLDLENVEIEIESVRRQIKKGEDSIAYKMNQIMQLDNGISRSADLCAFSKST